jgi:AraC-like DNA-binding protein
VPGPIPTHHLSERSRQATRVEHIREKAARARTPVHRHDFHELLFIATGTGTHMLDMVHHTVSAPSLHLVSPGQVHQLTRSADMTGDVVMFVPDALLGQGHAARTELFARAEGPTAIALTAAQLAEARALIALMERELAAERPMVEVVEGYLGILLIKCAAWAREGTDAPRAMRDAGDPVRRFLDMVEQGYLEVRQVAHYADRLAMTGDHLNTLVRERLGRTASSVIHDRLLLEAKRLLLHGDMSIKEVGYALGMKDPAYFTRWFSKAEGLAPAAFREAIREKYKA